MSKPSHLVFVYGTLKRGGNNHAFLSGQRFVGAAHTGPGYRLVHLGDYPGMIEEPTDGTGVAGEVWSVDNRCLAQLDELEGIAEGLYRRERIVLQPSGIDALVETYLYARDTTGLPAIAGGLWPV